MARPPAIERDTDVDLTLDASSLRLTDDQFCRFCHDNRDFRIEMSADGELLIMSPTKPGTGRRNATISARLFNWAEKDGTGLCFDSSSGFTLPNGARRSPDASWIVKERWNRLPEEEKDILSHICPDFVIELRSPSDRLSRLRKKMEEYIENGARLGWLLDPIGNRAGIYRPGYAVEVIERPEIIAGAPILPGFKFDFREIL